MRRLLLFLTYCVLSISPDAFGQYDIRNIGRIKGLTSGTVTSIAQDPSGFIWVGTSDGIKRYDGLELKEYKESSNLAGKDVLDILIDSKGRLWVGTTDGGLSLYKEETDNFRPYQSSDGLAGNLPYIDVRALHEDKEGNIWVATNHALNLYMEEADSFKVYNENLGNILVKDITSDDKGNIWCGTIEGGLLRFSTQSETFEASLNPTSGLNPKIQVVQIVGDEMLLGTRDHGLLSFDPASKELTSVFDPTSKNLHANVSNIFLDDQGRVWVGMNGNGLSVLKKRDGRWEEEAISKKLAHAQLSNSIYSTYIDEDHNLWIGTIWKGVFVLENLKNPLDFIGDVEDPYSVWSIHKENKKLVLGTDGHGLLVYDEDRDHEFVNDPKSYFDGYKISKVLQRKDGRYWLGTYTNGLILIDRNFKEIRRYKLNSQNPQGISANNIQDIIEDKNGGYWIGTWGGGLNYFDEKARSFEQYWFDPEDSTTISNNNVVDFQPRNDGKIWVATFGGGVNLLDPKTRKFSRFQLEFTNLKDSAVFPSKNITCVYDDGEGYLWIGTWNNGVQRVDLVNNELKLFKNYKGLFDKTVCGITQDANKDIWINTTEGVFKYSKERDSLFQFSDLEGEYQLRSFYRDRNNHIYLGSLDGVISFDPLAMKKHVSSPKLVFTDFKLFNESVPIGPDQPIDKYVNEVDQISLDFDQRVMTFDYSALVFPSSEDCEYVIKMENFDKDWRNNGRNRSATYTNLSPGNYVFKVKALDSEGSIHSEVISMPVKIAKPFYATWWAYLFYFLFMLLVLYFFRMYNIYWESMKAQLKYEQLSREKETELHNLKLKFFTNISHEIRTPVTLILGSINRLADMGVTEKYQLTALDNIRKNGSHLVKLVTELLDFRKLEVGDARLKVAEGDMTKFSKEIFLSFVDHANQKNIDYQYHSSVDNLRAWFDRDEMEKVLYNIISNAFKYTSEGGEIKVNVDVDDNHLFLTIKDNGRGISGDQLDDIFKRFYQSDNKLNHKNNDGFGLGLSITQDIVKLHGGEISADSELGVGSTFTIKLPLGKDHIKSEFLIEDFSDSEEVNLYTQGEQENESSTVFNFTGFQEMTVLIVEDNAGILQYLSEILEPHFQIITAENGKAALDMTYEEMPDLILSDVMMPVMDGITFCSKVKKDPRISHIPVILLTARTSLIHKKEGLDLGADDYITKPFNEIILKTRIRNLLHNRALLRKKIKTDMLIEPTELAIRSPDQEFLGKVSEMIEANITSEDLTAEFLAKEIGMSHSNIYKKLKALTGMSIVEFIRDFRLKLAVQLMVNQKYSVAEACYKVGFSDRRYFSSVFKSKYGMTPSQYAKNIGSVDSSEADLANVEIEK